MIDRLMNLVVIITIAFVSSLLGYWYQDRDPPIRDMRIETLTPVVRPGETVRFKFSFVRERHCRLFFEQLIFDSHRGRYPMPDEDFEVSPGDLGPDWFELAVEIPPRFRDGQADYFGIRTYYCNPLQRLLDWPIIVTMPHGKFEVNKAAPPIDFRSPSSAADPRAESPL